MADKTKVKEVYKSQLEMASIRLVKEAPLMSRHRIEEPMDAVEVLGQYLCEMDREVLCVINLRNDLRPINCSVCSIGSINQSIAHPRELLKTAILSNATSMIILHNHPSGNLEPSEADTILTDRMADACTIIGIPLADHIIVGGKCDEYFSFREKGILPLNEKHYETDYHNLEIDRPTVAEKKPKAHHKHR